MITPNKSSCYDGYDDWDDVFNWREYLELGTKSENNCNPNHNGGCGVGALIFWMIIALVIYYWWLL